MKIVCDSCSTKYSISDDKVRGKVFKIRCKKCSHIIVVKGTSEAAAPAPEAPAEAVWHLVVDGDQVGPLTDSDVRARLSRGEISVENYVWKEGFADWSRLADVAEFADVGTPVLPGGELFSDSNRDAPTEVSQRAGAEAAGGFFGTGAAGQEAARAVSGVGSSGRSRAPAAAAPPEDDAFSAPAGSAFGSDAADLFGSATPMAALAESGKMRGRGTNGTAPGRHDGGRVESLTAQRSENSVLFSLSNLQSLAAPAAAAKPSTTQNTDGSGLIDIRAMAASTLRAPADGASPFGSDVARGGGDDLPTFGAFSSAAPVLLSFPSSSGPPKWVYFLVGVAILLIVAVGAAAFSILGRPVVVEQVAAPPASALPSPSTSVTAEKVAVAPGSKPIAERELPPRESGEPAAAGAGEKAADKNPEKGGGKALFKHKGKRVGGPDGKSVAAAVGANPAGSTTPAEPDKPKPAKGSLDDLLEGALNGRKARPKVEDDAPVGKKSEKSIGGDSGGGGGPLAKAAVVGGMNGVKGKISACYAQFKVPGLAMVNVVIGKSGKVSSATVAGKFAGTPTGTCVESAVKSASFPPSEGLTTPYPFNLR